MKLPYFNHPGDLHFCKVDFDFSKLGVLCLLGWTAGYRSLNFCFAGPPGLGLAESLAGPLMRREVRFSTLQAIAKLEMLRGQLTTNSSFDRFSFWVFLVS